MRAALPLTLLLAACRPAHDPRRIQEALAKTPIDVAALAEAFRVEPGDLKIHAPASPPVTFARPAEPWILENVSARPLWVRAEPLRVRSQLEPFLPVHTWAGGRRGLAHEKEIPRPAFDPREWVLLPPGGRTPLAFDDRGWGPGDLILWAEIGDSGGWLVHRAGEFNERQRRPFERPLLASHKARTLLLPALDWPGAPWHDEDVIDPLPLSEGRFEWTTWDFPLGVFGPLSLEAFVADANGTCVARGTLEAESVVDDSPSRRTVYALPVALPPGDYRVLLWNRDAARWFLGLARHACDASDAAASRWIPFTIP